MLGAGPAGYAAAMRAHDLGKRVALVERARIGGAGVHRGALSSKTLWHLSNDYFNATRTDRGYRAERVEVSFRAVTEAVRVATGERHAQLASQLGRLTEPSPRGGTVTLFAGAASFVSPEAVVVRGPDGSETLVAADHFLIATGSRPRRPEGIPVDDHFVVTSDSIEELDDFPKSMVIIGAGVIGCEYATILGNFGRTHVSLIDRAARILPFEDEDVAAVIAQSFGHLGIRMHGASRLEQLRIVEGHVEYTVTNAAGAKEVYRVERALVSVGRAPNLEDLALERAGVKTAPLGYVEVKEGQTSQPHIYAAGDVTMDVALANVAELEGRHAVERMFGLNPPPVRYDALSAIMFLKPEVASVGFNELQAKKAGVPYRVAVLSNELIHRNIAMRATSGFVKLLVEREGSGRLLGLRVVGPQASSAIQGVAFLIESGAGLDAIDRCLHPHPAITEGVQECARLLLGRSVHKVEVFGGALLRTGEG